MTSPKTSTAPGRRFHSRPIEENFKTRTIKATAKVLWTDEPKINLYQSDGKAKWSTYEPKHRRSSFKHGGSIVLPWACMAASGTGSFIFIDVVMHDASSRMNLEVYRNISSIPIYRETQQTNRKDVYPATGKWPKINCQHNKGQF